MKSVERLTDNFKPEHYDLRLELDGTEKQLKGTVTIQGNKVTDDQPIKLHAKELTVTDASVDGQVATTSTGEQDELTIATDNATAGEHTVSVTFNGPITDHMHGAYPCYYEHDGTKKELLATQFESHHAREVFPSVDEPEAKATFAIQLTTDIGEDAQTVLGNMPIAHQETVDGRLVTTFEQTPRMSTYLAAFVVGALQKKTTHTKNGTEVSLYATHAQPAASLDFGLEVAKRSIEHYDEYFGTAYPLPKSDHVALPDFSSGAMENWGLVTYRESALLVDPENTSISSKRYVATVIAHELAHQWFGNLVTMKWWNDLWLNESFATLMEYLTVDELYPEWKIWLDFSTNESIMALRRDSIDGVQPVQVDVNHPDEIGALFDGAIVYAKGARLLRMIQQHIGEDAFRAGLKRYFADHAYGNTVGNDLWQALEDASGEQVTDIMNTWISQSGYPVVNVTRDGENITLTQEQFFIGPHEPSDKVWPIPLNANDPNAPKVMNEREVSWVSEGPLRLNRTDSAHFITNYDDLSRQELIAQVASGALDPIGRVQLLHEATLLARGGILSTDQLIPLIQAYEHETLEPVWDIISLSMGELRKFVEHDKEAETKLRKLSARMAREQYNRLGWEPKDGEAEDDAKLRGTIISMMLYGEDPDALAKAKELYETTPLEELNPELRSLIISSVARYGDGRVVDDLVAAYIGTQSPDLRQSICVGVTSTRVPEKIAQLLDNLKDSKIVRPQDVFRWYAYLVSGRDSRTQTWQWVRDNWDWVETTFGGDKSYDYFPRYAGNGLATREQLEQYKAFFGPKKDIVALTRTITMGISEIEGRVALIERDKDAVVAALLALED